MNYYPYGLLDAREIADTGKYVEFFERIKKTQATLDTGPTGVENAYSNLPSSHSNGKYVSTQGGFENNGPTNRQERRWWKLTATNIFKPKERL
ncbi:uncharacterized protein SOCG_02410 [Schizosaccharomyces octosporus yFS286]|uniref:Uncharacterized protein n=1 Tax=Schizosaccharomyces octosporus (strain yFS286) TaxID=483514 RepID=S9Q0X4_SCHOY|nr:uncharacterized protein SOCG_02410 [Schizosaccharomyces octosporus yFS286]EPX74931.1 hypothetical protein SOCG_02410 [Schizosaccharomyces octosporus yFS286]